jgi:uncharacterized protein YeaO (DUF488 family)
MAIRECRAADVAAMKDRSALGATILTTRKWLRLRGFNKECVDFWLPDLGPSLGLLYGYRDGLIDWTSFAAQYEAEQRAATKCRVVRYINGNRARHTDEVVQRNPLTVLREIEKEHGLATVICWENTAIECHRHLLVALASEEVTA